MQLSHFFTATKTCPSYNMYYQNKVNRGSALNWEFQ